MPMSVTHVRVEGFLMPHSAKNHPGLCYVKIEKRSKKKHQLVACTAEITTIEEGPRVRTSPKLAGRVYQWRSSPAWRNSVPFPKSPLQSSERLFWRRATRSPEAGKGSCTTAGILGKKLCCALDTQCERTAWNRRRTARNSRNICRPRRHRPKPRWQSRENPSPANWRRKGARRIHCRPWNLRRIKYWQDDKWLLRPPVSRWCRLGAHLSGSSTDLSFSPWLSFCLVHSSADIRWYGSE